MVEWTILPLGKSTMKKTFFMLAVATLMITVNGCGSCRGLFGKKTQTVARPVYSQCAPTCVPACNACGTGNEVTYGMPPVTTFSAPASIETMPTGL